MEIEYVSKLKKPDDAIDLYKALEWYQLGGYTDEDIKKANESFYSIYAYDGDTLVGLGRVASDGLIAAVMSGICVRGDYRRHGIGAEIVRRIVEYCQSGIYKLNVQIFCEDSLIHWYEGMGFEKMPVGMRKPMPMNEERCALKKNFGGIYGIEQITDLSEDFYWYNFDAFGDFSYYSGIGSEGVKVPFIRMTLFSNEPVKFSAELIFENVSEFEIGCIGVRTPLFGFDIMNTEKYGYAEKKRYKIRSLEDDDISFFCETFRVMTVRMGAKTARIASPERIHGGHNDSGNITRLIESADDAEAEYDETHPAAEMHEHFIHEEDFSDEDFSGEDFSYEEDDYEVNVPEEYPAEEYAAEDGYDMPEAEAETAYEPEADYSEELPELTEEELEVFSGEYDEPVNEYIPEYVPEEGQEEQEKPDFQLESLTDEEIDGLPDMIIGKKPLNDEDSAPLDENQALGNVLAANCSVEILINNVRENITLCEINEQKDKGAAGERNNTDILSGSDDRSGQTTG